MFVKASRTVRTARPDVLEIMSLRRWALSLLGRAAGVTVDARQSVAACTPASWDLFLRVERCAVALRTHIRSPAVTYLPDSIISAIDARATLELQRTLSAVAQMRLIARIAEDRGWKVVVLKGGVAAGGSEPVDVQDVDVLVTPPEAPALAQALDDLGHATSLAGPTHHLAPRVAPNSVAVEVHHRIRDAVDGDEQVTSLLDRAVPLKNVAGLWQLAPMDHLWQVLTHSVLRHADRRGRIRDLTLIGQAVSQCTPHDLMRVRQHIDEHPASALLGTTLNTVLAMRDGSLRDDPFTQLALRKYTFLRQRNGRTGNLRERALLILCSDSSLLRELRADLALPLRVHSEFGPLNWLASRARWLSGGVRQTLRIGRFGFAAGLVLLSDFEARRLYQQWCETLDEPLGIVKRVQA